jgi:hypothetical protein
MGGPELSAASRWVKGIVDIKHENKRGELSKEPWRNHTGD